MHAVKQYNPYLYGRKLLVLSDHSPLRNILKKKETSAKLARWALLLQDYDISIDYRAGNAYQKADCLSRIPIEDDKSKPQPEESPVIKALTTIDFH